jgi:hypothetical protein
MFDLIENSTYIQNINRGVTYVGNDPNETGVQRPADYFGAKTGEGMSYSQGSLYNDMQSRPAQNTRIQSNYMSANGLNSLTGQKKK